MPRLHEFDWGRPRLVPLKIKRPNGGPVRQLSLKRKAERSVMARNQAIFRSWTVEACQPPDPEGARLIHNHVKGGLLDPTSDDPTAHQPRFQDHVLAGG